MTRRWREFNVNQGVRVKLTPTGLAEFERQAREMQDAIPPAARAVIRLTPELDAEGYYTSELWRLMETFGHLCHIGCPAPFETAILLEDDAASTDGQETAP